MTIIAWDGKELVADRMTHMGGTPLPPMRKVHRLRAPNGKVALIGFSGHTAFAKSYLHWMTGGEEPQIKSGEDMKWSIILVEYPRWVWYRCENANRWDLLGAMSHWAIGSGCDYALGAMESGATGRQAVRIASRLDNQCGFGLNAVRF